MEGSSDQACNFDSSDSANLSNSSDSTPLRVLREFVFRRVGLFRSSMQLSQGIKKVKVDHFDGATTRPASGCILIHDTDKVIKARTLREHKGESSSKFFTPLPSRDLSSSTVHSRDLWRDRAKAVSNDTGAEELVESKEGKEEVLDRAKAVSNDTGAEELVESKEGKEEVLDRAKAVSNDTGAEELVESKEGKEDVLDRAKAVSHDTGAEELVESKEGKEDVLIKEYTVNLHKHLHGCTSKKKSPKAIKEIRKFAQKEMKTSDVRVDVKLNKQIWSRGIQSVPRSVRIRITRKINYEEDAKEKFYSVVTLADIPQQGLKGLGTEFIY